MLTKEEQGLLSIFYGVLSARKAVNKDARRRQPFDDEDSWCEFGEPYALDAWAKIARSKSFRRSRLKTQVFHNHLQNAHLRTRLVHMVETAGIATTAARILGLNQSLVQAIGLGHDLGHTPFGHAGEEFLTKMLGREFHHRVFGCIVAQQIERGGRGLNLTHQTLMGMFHHSHGGGEGAPIADISEEANLVKQFDKILNTWADYNDLQRSPLRLKEKGVSLEDYPELVRLANWFGKNQREREARTIYYLCWESADVGHVSFHQTEVAQMFKTAKKEIYKLYPLLDFDDFRLLEVVYRTLEELEPEVDPAVLFALLTDNDVFTIAGSLNFTAGDLARLDAGELLPNLRRRSFNLFDPDLDW
jgi:hypothetical protein